MQNLWTKYQGHGVQVVAVHATPTEADGLAWLTGLSATFPAVQDDAARTIMNSYAEGDIFFPQSYVIGRGMVIQRVIAGAVAEDVMEGYILDAVYMRNPVDIEMVMDVSDSMNSPSPSDPGGDSKLTMMKQATTMITDFLNDHGQVDDRMGLIWFTDDVSEYQNAAGQKLIPVTANSVDLKAQINTHGTGTCTAMGAGLQKAFDTLSSSTQKRFVILCTDGMQNIEPKVTKVGDHYEIIDSGGWLCGGHSSVPAHPGVNITSYNTTIHTIGVGITVTYANLLQEIANETNGFYRGTNDPENDLDLVYFVDLCNSMADGSPALVHHNTGRLLTEQCEVVETFYLNRSARKITVMLSWKKSQGCNLTFWLYAPDDTLLNLHYEMKRFESYCLATIYLPRHQDGKELQSVGEWRMVIRGETHGSDAEYHAFIIAEDRETKYQIDYPRKYYEVGDILPIRIGLKELNKPIVEVSEILMETANLRVSMAELLARYKVSPYELTQKMKVGKGKYQKDPLLLKIESMASDPHFSELLRPVRKKLSLKEGTLECNISDREIVIPVTLKQSGLNSFKVTVQCETHKSGPVSRTDMVSVFVGPGKVDPKLTRVNFMEVSKKKLKGGLVIVTPRNEKDQLLGPGLGHEFKAMVGKQSLEIEVNDQLDGTYQIKLSLPEELKAKAKEKRLPVNITLQGKHIWKGML